MTKCPKCGQMFDPNDDYMCPCEMPRPALTIELVVVSENE